MDSSLLEVFVFENIQLLEQLEKTLLAGEKNATLSKEQINDIFRVMHTIKGSASMMEFAGMAKLAHALEDLIDFIRSNSIDDSLWSGIFDIVLDGIDFFKEEIAIVQNGMMPDGDISELYQRAIDIHANMTDGESANKAAELLDFGVGALQAAPSALDASSAVAGASDGTAVRSFKAQVEFSKGCGMETIRAMGIVSSLNELCVSIETLPSNLEVNCDKEIVENGFAIFITSNATKAQIQEKLAEAILVQGIDLEEISMIPENLTQMQEQVVLPSEPAKREPVAKPPVKKNPDDDVAQQSVIKQNFISINVNKVDRLMNLVGEIVTTESMVTKNPDLANLKLENFSKNARHLRKLTNELQDVVMSIRMVPISSAFTKMQRIVRDMSKKINKEADLVIIGETTEVDKNVIDCLTDPLMHLIRNSMDHGLESAEERIAVGKPAKGTITLEAYNTGGDVIVTVSDDGKGLDKSGIVRKAIERGITTKSEDELTDTEAYSFILEPGFSTNDTITEYSGRGVGMDVVHKNIERINGTISVESKPGKGMTNKMHIPLTLSIVEGMVVSVGKEQYIIPILSIRESFESRLQKIFTDPNGMEMVIIRGECYRIMSLSRIFNIPTEVTQYNEGIMVMIETEMDAACLFVDKLIGEQQAVIKPIPEYITRTVGRVRGISGCTVLGDGSISMILDTNALLSIR